MPAFVHATRSTWGVIVELTDGPGVVVDPTFETLIASMNKKESLVVAAQIYMTRIIRVGLWYC